MSTTENVNYSEQVEALSKSVLTIDGARRVGWAKAFSALDQLESASADVNRLRDDMLLYRERISYLWGYIQSILDDLKRPGHYVLLDLRRNTQIETSHAGDTAFLDLAFVRQGREHAHVLLDRLLSEEGNFRDPEELLAAKILKRKEKKRLEKEERVKREEEEFNKRIAERVDALAEKRMFYKIMTECGFDTKAELREALRAFRWGRFPSRVFTAAQEELVERLGLSSEEELRQAVDAWKKRDQAEDAT